MERQLATVQRIENITPIEGADSIECAHILGWTVVVGKGQFKIGDLCIYCEIDSVLPERPEFEFLRKNCWVDNGVVRGFRIRTVKLRKQLSQGIVFNTNIANSYLRASFGYNASEISYTHIGFDLTDMLGIVKFEKPIPTHLAGIMKGNFPTFIPKTDEIRIQNCGRLLNIYNDETWIATEKLDGTSATYYVKDGEYGVCSRNVDFKIEDNEGNTYINIGIIYEMEKKLRSLGFNVAFQGEIIGEGIQGNKYNIKGKIFRLFNIFNIDEQKYFNYKEFMETAKILNIPTVDVVGQWYNQSLPKAVSEILELAKGQSILNPKQKREGLVFRPIIEHTLDNFGRVSFKAINNDFLLKNDD